MDNIMFNVNGNDDERLKTAIALIMTDEYGNNKTVQGMAKTKNGLEFYFHILSTDVQKSPFAFDKNSVYALVTSYLFDDTAIKDVSLEAMETEYTGDGGNAIGWRVYTDKWGCMSGHPGFAVKPINCWYGK